MKDISSPTVKEGFLHVYESDASAQSIAKYADLIASWYPTQDTDDVDDKDDGPPKKQART